MKNREVILTNGPLQAAKDKSFQADFKMVHRIKKIKGKNKSQQEDNAESSH